MDIIWDDYMATNHYAASYTEKIISKVTKSGMNGEILRPLLEVRKEYLAAALARIDEKYDGLNNFVEKILEADVVGLRERYLTNDE
jgi:protein-tyrosine phosphatase